MELYSLIPFRLRLSLANGVKNENDFIYLVNCELGLHYSDSHLTFLLLLTINFKGEMQSAIIHVTHDIDSNRIMKILQIKTCSFPLSLVYGTGMIDRFDMTTVSLYVFCTT